jgi:hypothetical protein
MTASGSASHAEMWLFDRLSACTPTLVHRCTSGPQQGVSHTFVLCDGDGKLMRGDASVIVSGDFGAVRIASQMRTSRRGMARRYGVSACRPSALIALHDRSSTRRCCRRASHGAAACNAAGARRMRLRSSDLSAETSEAAVGTASSAMADLARSPPATSWPGQAKVRPAAARDDGGGARAPRQRDEQLRQRRVRRGEHAACDAVGEGRERGERCRRIAVRPARASARGDVRVGARREQRRDARERHGVIEEGCYLHTRARRAHGAWSPSGAAIHAGPPVIA